MCMEDIRIGRQTKSFTRNLNSTPGANNGIPANADRIALLISSSNAGDLFLTTASEPANNTGLRLPMDGLPLLLTISDYGDMVRGQILAFHTGGGDNTGYIETILQKA